MGSLTGSFSLANLALFFLSASSTLAVSRSVSSISRSSSSSTSTAVVDEPLMVLISSPGVSVFSAFMAFSTFVEASALELLSLASVCVTLDRLEARLSAPAPRLGSALAVDERLSFVARGVFGPEERRVFGGEVASTSPMGRSMPALFR